MVIDMQPFSKVLEKALIEYLGLKEKPVFGFCYVLPGDKTCHWITNVSSEDGAAIFLETGLKMQNRDNLG